MASSRRAGQLQGTDRATPGEVEDGLTLGYLPLEARTESGRGRSVIRVSLKKQEVTVRKEAFVSGTATVRKVPVSDVERVGDTLRTERLRVDVDGDVSVLRERDIARAPEDREQAR